MGVDRRRLAARLDPLSDPRPAGAVAALALLSLVPAVGPLLAWPFLFAVPGWLLVRRTVPGLSAPGRAGAGIVVSVLVSAHVIFLISLGLGYGRLSLVLTVALLMALSLVLADSGHAAAGDTDIGASAGRDNIGCCRGQWLVGAGTASVVAVILGGALFHHIDQGWAAGGANWSDLMVHVSIAATVQHGNLPPDVPFFAGAPLTYHWFSDLHAAMAASLSGLSLTTVMGLSSAVMAGALALVVAELALVLGAGRRAAVIASVLAVFGGGLGWVKLPIDLVHHRAALAALLHMQQYDFDSGPSTPLFHIPPVFDVGLLVQRATAYGLPILITVVLLARATWGRSQSGVILTGVVLALLAPFNFFALPVAYLLVALVLVERRFWRLPRWPAEFGLLVLPSAYAVVFVVRPLRQNTVHGNIALVAGWRDGPVGQGWLGYVVFYATNLGVPFILALVVLLRRGTRSRLLLGGWMAALLLLPNLIQVSAVSFDSSKFFQLMWPAVAVLAAVQLARWRAVIAVPLVALSTLTSVAAAVWVFADDRVVFSDDQYAAAAWIDSSTPRDAVFVTPSFINMPTDLAGRLRLTGFSPYTANYGYDQTARDADVGIVYCGGDAAAAEVMAHDGAGWVLDEGFDCGGSPRTDFAHSPRFETTFRRLGVTVYRLR